MFHHKFPHFLIKNWKIPNTTIEKGRGQFQFIRPYSILGKKTKSYHSARDMGADNYYSQTLENKLSKVERVIANILREKDFNNTSTLRLTNRELIEIILYVQIQSIRLENVCHYVKNPSYYKYGKNFFFFGIRTSTKKNKVLELTELFCDVFLNKDLSKIEKFSYVMERGVVLWRSTTAAFVTCDKVIFTEVDNQSRFLFALVPISPQSAIVVSANAQYSDAETLNETLQKTGKSSFARAVQDKYLINNFKKDLSFINDEKDKFTQNKIPIYFANEDFDNVINAMCADANELIFSLESAEKIEERITHEDLQRM